MAPYGNVLRIKMNWANRLTVARFFLTLLFVFCLSSTFPFNHTTALFLFIVAGITDYADGEIARRWSLVTDFGALMDPVVDKIMIAAAFVCLVAMHAVPAWVAIVIISREFLITGLRMLAATKGRILPAEKMGKHKTAWQIITVLFFLGMLALGEIDRLEAAHWWALTWRYGGILFMAGAMGFTLYSGFGYLWRNRALIQTAS